MARFNTIAVHITLKDSGGIEQYVVLPNIKCPVEYKVLAGRISRMGGISRSLINASLTTDFLQSGYPTYPEFTSQDAFKLKVTAGQSSFDEATGGTINLFADCVTVDEGDTENRPN
jgi:hypothetical protein